MRPRLCTIPALATSVILAACGGGDDPLPKPASASAPPAVVKPAINPIDTRQLSVANPACEDFDEYVNGKWRAAEVFAPSADTAGTMFQMSVNSYQKQAELIQMGGTGPHARLLTALLDSRLNVAAVEEAGAKPIQPELARIDAIGSMPALLAYLSTPNVEHGGSVLGFGLTRDEMQPYAQAVNLAAVALREPKGKQVYDADTSPDATQVRDRYIGSMARLFQLAGIADPEGQARIAFDVEARIGSLPATKGEDPQTLVTVAEANARTPRIDWGAYFSAQGVALPARFALDNPKRMEAFDRMLSDLPLAQWKTTLKAWVLQDAAPYLSAAFQSSDEEVVAAADDKQKAAQNAISAVLTMVADQPVLSASMSVVYVEHMMKPEAIDAAKQMVEDIRVAFRERLRKAEWLTPATRARALEKESRMTVSVATQERAPDVTALLAKLGPDYYANAMRVLKDDNDHKRALIGSTELQRSDRQDANQQEVNATYSARDNAVVLHAALLQPPLFDAGNDAAFNYGGVGAIIGHEITHGFDPSGSLYDGVGRRTEWWQPADRAVYQLRADRLVAQFNAYEALPGLHVDGRQTLDENIADLGGALTALDALRARLKNHPSDNRSIDGLSQSQRFFVGTAQYLRKKQTPEALTDAVRTDEHAPARFRLNGMVSNMPAFAATFACKPGQPMAPLPLDQVRIW